MITDVKKAAEILKNNDDFLILSHANPDGDTLGCAYGLCGMLQKMGKRAKVMCADEIAPRMEYLRDTVIQQSFEEKTVVSVDVADRKLLGDLDTVYGGRIFLAIDHHESRQEFAEYTLVDPDAAAACELIFQIAEEMNAQLDGEIASCLYTGLATDTGCFKYSNTTGKTHMIAAKLMAYDFDVADINYRLFDMKSKGRLELEQAITQGMEFFCDDRVAVVWLTTELMDRFAGRVDSEDFNGLASLPRQVEGVILGATVKQKGPTTFKVSVRTAEPINAGSICALFGGGGHARAAGCSIEGSMEFVRAKLLPVFEKALKANE